MLTFLYSHFQKAKPIIIDNKCLMVSASQKASVKTVTVFTLQVTTYWQPFPWPGTAEWFPHMTPSSSLTLSLRTADSLPKSPGDMLTSQPRCLAWRWHHGANTDMNMNTEQPMKSLALSRKVQCHRKQADAAINLPSAPLCSHTETTCQILV